jgi:pimeloyl-ACP methyl ester carboxylesterase
MAISHVFNLPATMHTTIMTQLAVHNATPRSFEHRDWMVVALDIKPDRGHHAHRAPRTVLLVPGYTGSKEDFAPLLNPLASVGLRAVSIDLPGQYQSSGPDDPAVYTTTWFGSVVREVARQLQCEDAAERGIAEPTTLLGHSFGGLVCRAAVIDEPALFDSLTLLCSGPGKLGGVRARMIEELRPLRPEGKAAIYAALLHLQFQLLLEAQLIASIPQLAAFLRERFLASSLASLEGMADAITSEPDRTAELLHVDVPILVCHGEHDNGWAPQVQAEMAVRLGARHAVIPGARHSPAVEQTELTLAALLEFWKTPIPLERKR